MSSCGRGRRNCGREGPSDPEAAIAKVRAAAEEMTMKRYVHGAAGQPDRGREEGLLCRLDELNRVADYQNKILVEISGALERLGRPGAE